MRSAILYKRVSGYFYALLRDARKISAGTSRQWMKGGFDVKVRSSVKPICEKCKVIKRKGSVRIICEIQSINSVRANTEHLVNASGYAQHELSEKIRPKR